MGGFVTNYQAGGRHDFPFMPRFHNPFFKGIRVEVTSNDSVVEHNYIVTHKNADFLSMAISSSRYEDKDNFNLFVNDNQLMETIYTKELPEGMYLMVCVPLKQGDRIKFQFINSSLTSKAIWVNYQTLIDEYTPATTETP